MSETLKLRTTAFGGFQRQDVVDYIEQSARVTRRPAQRPASFAEGGPGGD